MTNAKPLPLTGCRVMVTRPEKSEDPFVDAFRRLGAHVRHIPLIRFEPPKDLQPIRHALADPFAYDWLILTSPKGVHSFFDALHQCNGIETQSPTLSLPPICAVGPGTQATLARYGYKADLLPDTPVGSAIPGALITHLGRANVSNGLKGFRFLLPRSDQADPTLITSLQRLGASVTAVTMYTTVPDATGAKQVLSAATDGDVDILVFTSPSAVASLKIAAAEHAERHDGRLVFNQIGVVCIGPVTGRKLTEVNDTFHFQPGWIKIAARPTPNDTAAAAKQLWPAINSQHPGQTI